MGPSRHLAGYDFKASVHGASCTRLSKKPADALSSFKPSKLSKRDQNTENKLDQSDCTWISSKKAAAGTLKEKK